VEGNFQVINPELFPTPSFVVDRVLLRKNLEILDSVQKRTGAKILLALKGYAMFSSFPLVLEYLHGICASSPHEARLGRENFGREVHSFAAAYSEADFIELAELSDHIVLNSMSQYERFLPLIKKNADKIEFGLRINPEHRETEVEMYDPCAPLSRLGITRKNFPDRLPEYISGLHFHTLCQQNSDALARTMEAAEKSFGEFFSQCKWVNFGGGHHITRADYNIDLLCKTITAFKNKYNVHVYLEPGEAVALNTGFLVSQVLDIIDNEIKIAILDTSAAAHMPDVLEMPYRPHVINSGQPGEFPHTHRLAGLSCLAGDVIGDYSFREPLNIGDRLVFTDMAIYSMVKTNTFNGIKLPDIYYYDSSTGEILHKKTFGYADFKGRLS
jgi:carboxynorspermidine decarboxylase